MCYKKNCNSIIAVIISLIIAIIIGVVYTPVVVTGLVTLLYIIIGVSAFLLISLIAIALLGRKREEECICKCGLNLTVGTLGAIIASSLTMCLTLSATLTSIFIGITTFFIVLAIIQFVLLLLCLIKVNCMHKE